MKRYINLAINKDLFDLHRYPFRKYKIKYMESKRTHLTPEELEQLDGEETAILLIEDNEGTMGGLS